MKKILVFIFGIFLAVFNFQKLQAATYYDNIIEKSQMTGVYVYYRSYISATYDKSHQISVITRRSDGRFVYCMQPGTLINENITYTGYDNNFESVTNLPTDKWRRVRLLAYYGYKYKDADVNHDDLKWYVVTQLLIWQTVSTDYDIYLSADLGNHRIDAYQSEINELENLVAQHNISASFDETSFIMSKGETKVLTDYNGVLSKYSVENCENCEARISGNELYITAIEEGDISITLSKYDKLYSAPPIVYIDPSSQNVIMVGSYDPFSVNVNATAISGELTLKKYDSRNRTCKSQENSSLAGSVYKVYDEDGTYIDRMVIDSNCEAHVSGLSLGNFYVVESEAGLHYELDTQKHYFEVILEDTKPVLTVYDNAMFGELEVTKHDSYTKSCEVSGVAVLAGAKYGVYRKSNGTLYTTLTIGEDCTATTGKNLVINDYFLKEISEPKGYKKDENTYDFSITPSNYKVKQEIKVYDIPYTTFLTINKTFLTELGTVEAEIGAEFEIWSKNRNIKVATLTIDESATARELLFYDEYIIKQVKGREDYTFSKDMEINVDEIINPKTYITLNNVPYVAKLKVIKVDENDIPINISGIKFKIFDITHNKYVCQNITYPYPQTICEYETDKNGEFITPKYLLPADYRLEEIDQYIYGYLWNKEPIEFTIGENTKTEYIDNLGTIFTLRFTNQTVKGKIEINKIGEEFVVHDGTYSYEEINLSDVTYGLYDTDMNLISKIKTDEEGKIIIEDLDLGKYILKELSTRDDSYVLDEIEYEINLEYKDQYTPIITEVLELKNYLKKGVLEFTKTDLANGTPIPNVEIEIYMIEENTLDDEEITKLVFSGFTDENGKITITDLKTGKYYIIEKTPADDSYELNTEKVYFEILEDKEVVKANMTNEKKEIIVPDTLANSYVMLVAGIFTFIGILIIIIANKRK